MIKTISGSSLALRLCLLIACVLVAAGLITALTLYASVNRSLHHELRNKLDVQMTWLQSSLELEGSQLDFEPNVNVTAAERWKIATADGRVLWHSQWVDGEKDVHARIRTFVMGEPNASPVAGASLAAGTENGRTVYRLPPEGKRLDLRISVGVSPSHADEELGRLAMVLWIGSPLALLILIAALSWLIHKQLAPLQDMARQAANIGPKNPGARIIGTGGGTECARLRASLNAMVERLAVGLEREQRFSSAAAHEFRTPLAQLRTQIEVALRRPRPPEEYQATLANCLIDIKRLQTLISNLLLLSHDMQEYSHTSQEVELAAVLRRAVGGAEGTARIKIPDLADLRVAGTDEILTCAFRNVLENALRYAPGSPPVIEVGKNSKGTVTVSISDSGPGIPKSAREYIFQPLVRLDQAIGSSPGGFGLGLAIARMAVQACGGEINCMERPDGQNGSTFLITLKGINKEDK